MTYVSTTLPHLDADQLLQMLAAWRTNNEQAGVTGMLLYSGGNVIQTLEGPEDGVERIFAAIEPNPLHHGIIVILRDETTHRAFPNWSMGFRHVGRGDLQEVAGFSNFLAERGTDVNATAAQFLLESFRDTIR